MSQQSREEANRLFELQHPIYVSLKQIYDDALKKMSLASREIAADESEYNKACKEWHEATNNVDKYLESIMTQEELEE
jgi:hypothetical protein